MTEDPKPKDNKLALAIAEKLRLAMVSAAEFTMEDQGDDDIDGAEKYAEYIMFNMLGRTIVERYGEEQFKRYCYEIVKNPEG